MGRPKGGKNRKYTVEEKLKVVRMSLEEHKSQNEIAELTGINESTFRRWIYAYLENGEEGLKNKKKTGNKYAALHTSKKISEVERLKLELMKKDIEIERLKKGYTVKGDGVEKEYVTINDANTQSSKN